MGGAGTCPHTATTPLRRAKKQTGLFFFFVGKNGNLELEGADGLEVFHIQYENIIEFSTGASRPPPAGFTSQPTIAFHVDNHFPRANTCTNTLYLPIKKPLSSDRFLYSMTYGILNSAGFGRV